jgi:hypothetical protein
MSGFAEYRAEAKAAGRWAWGLFQIMTAKGRAHRYGSFWGDWGVDYRKEDKSFTVTHIPTGMMLTKFDKLRQARRFCEAIDGFTDWSLITSAGLSAAGINAAAIGLQVHQAALRVTGARPALTSIVGGQASA